VEAAIVVVNNSSIKSSHSSSSATGAHCSKVEGCGSSWGVAEMVKSPSLPAPLTQHKQQCQQLDDLPGDVNAPFRSLMVMSPCAAGYRRRSRLCRHCNSKNIFNFNFFKVKNV
jgi:hypothetical protein